MTAQRLLRIATVATAIALLCMIVVIWRSATEDARRADDIAGRTRAAMEHIAAEANRMEREAGEP